MKNNFLKNISYSYLGVIITSIIGFITVPISLNYFGKELYGLFSITSDTLAYLSLFSFGVPWATATIFSNMRSKSAQIQLIKRAMVILSSISLGLIICQSLVVIFYPDYINFIAGISPQNIGLAKIYTYLSLLFFIFRLPFSLFNQLLIIIGKSYLAKIFDIITSCLNLSILLLIVHLKLSIVWFSLFNGVVAIVIAICTLIIFYIENRKIEDNHESHNENITYRNLLGNSWYFFINNIGGLITWNTDSLLITHFLGLNEVAQYALLSKIFMLIMVMVNQIMNVLNPIFPKYFKHDDKSNLVALVKYSNIILSILGGCAALGVYFWYKDVLHVWVHKNDVFIGYNATFAFACYCFMICSTLVNYSIMVFLGKIKQTYKLTLIEGLLNFVFSVVLIKLIGIAGVVWGTVIAHFIVMYLILPRILNKELANIMPYDYKYNVATFISFLCLSAVYFWYGQNMQNIIDQLLLSIFLFACYLLLNYVFFRKILFSNLKNIYSLLR